VRSTFLSFTPFSLWCFVMAALAVLCWYQIVHIIYVIVLADGCLSGVSLFLGLQFIHQNDLEGFVKHRLLGLTPRILNLVGLGWLEKSRVYQVPRGVDAAGEGRTSRTSVRGACGRNFRQEPRRLGVGIHGSPTRLSRLSSMICKWG